MGTTLYRELSSHRLLDAEPDLRASDPWDYAWWGHCGRSYWTTMDRFRILRAVNEQRLGRSTRRERILACRMP